MKKRIIKQDKLFDIIIEPDSNSFKLVQGKLYGFDSDISIEKSTIPELIKVLQEIQEGV